MLPNGVGIVPRRRAGGMLDLILNMKLQRVLFLAIGLSVPLAATHCSSSKDSQGGPTVTGSGGTTTGIDVTLPPGGAAGDGSGNGSSLNPLCGGYDTYDCIPDDVDACHGVEFDTSNGSETSSATGSGGTGSGVGGSTGAAGQAGQAGQAGEGGQAGAPGSGGIPIDAGPDVAIGTDSEPLEPSGVACRVRASDDGPVRVCALAGAGQENDPCTRGADCAAGFACVSEGEAGLCRPYCCKTGPELCDAGQFCAERTLFGTDLEVAVCARADNCSLSQQYPCPEGQECQCPEGTACLVVRRDGTTTCAVPGRGKAGEECPCDWGHVCSQASGTCLRLCETVLDTDQCDGGVCQAADALPETWGVCINTSAGE